MITARGLTTALAENGFTFYAGVPCSFFRDTIDLLEAQSAVTYIAAPNEGAAVAAAAGAQLAGRRAAVLLQSSGFGNLVNPLTTLSLVYRVPVLLLISARGYPEPARDEPQHRILGATLLDLLRTFGVHHAEVPDDDARLGPVVARLTAESVADGGVSALIVPRGAIGDAAEATPTAVASHPLLRVEAIAAIAETLTADELVVSTTGRSSRELFCRHDRPGNFYMQGSMGHAMAIGLGLALSRPQQRVIVIDGDGAALMHMGSMSMIGHYRPANLLHVILDNEVYESTGGQATTSTTTRLDAVAEACGYRRTYYSVSAAELSAALREARQDKGPVCILAKISRRSSTGLPRVTGRYGPEETARRFTEFIHVR